MNLTTKITASLLTLGTLMTGILPATARPGALDARSNLRSAPSLQASVQDVLPLGSPVEVMNIRLANDRKYWYYVQPQVEGTASGWIRGDLVRFRVDQKRYATLTGSQGSKINVRAAAHVNSKAIHYGLSGDLVTIEGSSKEYGKLRWYRVRFPSNATGWVREDLLSIWPQGCIITCPEH